MALPAKYKHSDNLILWLSLFHDQVTTDETEVGQIQDSLAGYLKGCIPSNGTDATNDLDFSAGFAFDGTRGYAVGAMTKRADANWASGTGNGGRASGATAWGAADWHLFLLMNPSTGTTDFGFDTSLTATNLLTDTGTAFTVAKRVGSLRTSGAAWPLFSAREIGIGVVEYLLKTPVFQFTKAWGAADNTAQTGTLADAPGGIQVKAIMHWVFFDGSPTATSGLLVTSMDQTDTTPDSGGSSWVCTFRLDATDGIVNGLASGEIRTRTSTSRTLRYRGTGTTSDHVISTCLLGWEDFRI